MVDRNIPQQDSKVSPLAERIPQTGRNRIDYDRPRNHTSIFNE